jgi:S-adenosylmethionine synthetase
VAVKEALAGKNPVSHVGKLYNVAARNIAVAVAAAL